MYQQCKYESKSEAANSNRELGGMATKRCPRDSNANSSNMRYFKESRWSEKATIILRTALV